MWLGQRAYSIRTRIKTLCGGKLKIHSREVREHIPLEQGLRPLYVKCYIKIYKVREHIPLEQGLRPNEKIITKGGLTVREHIPLEQGLRRHDLRYQLFHLWSESIFH